MLSYKEFVWETFGVTPEDTDYEDYREEYEEFLEEYRE